MDDAVPVVVVIDDDASFRRSTERLLRAAGHAVESFSGATEFLKAGFPGAPACLVLDVCMPGLNGLDLQSMLAGFGIEIPIIFITGHGDVPMSVRAMKAGATEFLLKPVHDEDLLEAVALALKRDRAALRERAASWAVRGRRNTLTGREREVMSLVVEGKLNKQIAAQLGIREVTVKVHRGHIMEKMGAGSLAELVRMYERLLSHSGD